jgi:hypothetical protein
MGAVLRQVCRESYREHGVMLGVLVGNKKRKFPSDGFFELARELGAMRPNELPQEFYKAELQKVFAIYGPERQL